LPFERFTSGARSTSWASRTVVTARGSWQMNSCRSSRPHRKWRFLASVRCSIQTKNRSSRITFAERAACDFIAKSGGATALTTVLPGAIFGPALSPDTHGSVDIIRGMLQGRPPGLPRLGFCVMDVRDLADVHIRAMASPEAAGQRFIAAGDFIWMREIAEALRATLGDRARKVPGRKMRDFVLRLVARFRSELRALVPMLGRAQRFTSAKAQRELGFAPRSSRDAVVDCARSLA
jgi:dihydroflavonol-4-reductase